VRVTTRGEHVVTYAMNNVQAVVAALRNHGESWTLEGLPPPTTDWAIPGRALNALAASKGDADCTSLAPDEFARVVVLSRPGLEVVAKLDSYEKPVPAIADIAIELLAGTSGVGRTLEIERRGLQRVFDTGALLGTVAELVYQPERSVLEVRAQRNDERLHGDARIEIAVLRGPPEICGVTLDCSRVQHLLATLPGQTVSLDLGTRLGGPEARLWPTQALADDARVVHVLRAQSGVHD
jgi:hypothetical protein